MIDICDEYWEKKFEKITDNTYGQYKYIKKKMAQRKSKSRRTIEVAQELF